MAPCTFTEAPASVSPKSVVGVVDYDKDDMMPTPEMAKRQPLSRAQVLELSDSEKLCLIIIGQTVYDVTRWQHKHPGGHLTIRALCGKDATDAFNSSHDEFVKTKLLKGFYFADLEPDAEEDKVGIAFRDLTQKFEEAGLFETD